LYCRSSLSPFSIENKKLELIRLATDTKISGVSVETRHQKRLVSVSVSKFADTKTIGVGVEIRHQKRLVSVSVSKFADTKTIGVGVGVGNY
jgi:ribosomal protein L7Ae-like RNA K-turn-binding protein